MKPVELRISGWGPYKELQTIDFTRMEERGLFLITGATGAGKTTIFNAIMYGTGKGIGAFGLCKAGYAHLCGAVDDT